MRRILCLLAISLAPAGGCKSSHFWRAKPDNFARRSIERTEKLWLDGNSDTGNLRVGDRNLGAAQ